MHLETKLYAIRTFTSIIGIQPHNSTSVTLIEQVDSQVTEGEMELLLFSIMNYR